MIGMKIEPGMVRYTNITLKDCIRAAYRVRDFQVEGPAWIGDARFEIVGKFPVETPADRIADMLQVLLEERFHLVLRQGTKEESVYAITVAAGGAKLKPADGTFAAGANAVLGADGKPRPPVMFQMTGGGVKANAPRASLKTFAELISRFTSRPVVDLTEIPGEFSFEATFANEVWPEGMGPVPEGPTASEPAPSLADALKPYGLKVEARKAPLEHITVVSSLRTPIEN